MSARDELAALIVNALKQQDDPYVCVFPDEWDSVIIDGHCNLLTVADAILAAGWHPPTVSCAVDKHIIYESCGICGDIPEEIAEQVD